MRLDLSRLARLEKAAMFLTEIDDRAGLNAYAGDPVGYAENILGVVLTPDQRTILQGLHTAPYKTLVPSGHNCGKTFIAAAAVNYWYDSFDPSVVITTAPTKRDVEDLLWTEVRLQRRRANLPGDFIGPSAPEMRTNEDHYAKGFTARKGESFQGRHRDHMLFIFDEANGIESVYWDALRTMFDPTLGHAILAIFNPTSTTSRAYIEDSLVDEDDPDNPAWNRFRLSSLNHPNIAAELLGQPKPIPGAVSLAMVNEWVRSWCEPIEAKDRKATDLEWPPSSITGQPGQWIRPGPIFQARAQGLWPETGDGVWSDALWQACLDNPQAFPLDQLPEIGCDTALGKGEDWHAIHVRWGPCSFHHETSNTMDAVRIAGRLAGCVDMAVKFVNARRPANVVSVKQEQVLIKIDDDGTGNAVAALLLRKGFHVVAVGAGTSASKPRHYPNKRSELWFDGAERAKAGLVDLSRLDRPTARRLKQQLLAPEWDLNGAGQRVVESKDDTKDKIGRSPDDADAFNLAYADIGMNVPSMVEPEKAASGTGGHYGKRRTNGRWA